MIIRLIFAVTHEQRGYHPAGALPQARPASDANPCGKTEPATGLSETETSRCHSSQYPNSRRWLRLNGSPAARTLPAAAATS
jgi:hypothetical protein